MLGGQYWGLRYYFSPPESDYIYFDESETGTGNNILVQEKIKDNWYFYYHDYDGKLAENGD